MSEIKSVDLNSLLTEDIKCFQHCRSSERFLCFELPKKCPTCESNLNSSIKFKVPPFVLPKPLKLTNTRLKCLPPYCLLLQPTDFNYHKLASQPDIGDLHIGVTNSDSDVYDFNQNGLNKNARNWIDVPSIVIEIKKSLNGNSEEPVDYKWDMILDRHWKKRKDNWNRVLYDENKFNCLDFVINFLFEYGIFGLNQENGPSVKNNTSAFRGLLKQKISRDFIEPEFFKCLKYLKLIVSLSEQKFLVEKLNDY